MAKAKASAKAGQKTLGSFFGGGKPPKDTKNVDEEPSDEEMDAPIQASKTDGKVDSSDLPPMHDIPAIFSDLISRIPEIKQVAERVEGRKLRVATMCSGTESPLLALDLICQNIREQFGISLEVDHVFSCEIEPFKQAYIERNFQPPLLFRDVCELGDDEATTAYGALAPVPGDVDLLVAGTSCVDYSNLNNEKQDIDGNGESGRTFRGMMSWVTNHRPPLVILENVCSAPWERVVQYFEKKGYSATFSRVDTKHYYIPHTRTRVYLLAVDSSNENLPQKWKDYVTAKLKRHASSTLDAFLLPSDDPRIHQARQKLVKESFNGAERRTGRTDWGRCESRHQRARLEELLGPKRPLTNWDEGGSCKLPDFAWGDWGTGQVERVWDLMDITLLRSAQKGIDPSYKTLVWNLSQNVDRTIGAGKTGICPCLTPSMIPYITNRGGPMVGLEALSMQGLPIDKLLLTRESEDQLADLAGNAMSSTVVGACILAALVVGKNLLKTGDDRQTYENKKMDIDDEENAHSMDVDEERSRSLAANINGAEDLTEKPLDLSATATLSLAQLLEEARSSVRLCQCEGRKDITTRELMLCQDCGSSSCTKCGGRPEHNFQPLDTSANPRTPPSIFGRKLKSSLPMTLSLSGFTEEALEQAKQKADASIPSKRWSSWLSAVLRCAETELRFVEAKRQEIWSVIYESPTAFLELQLHPQQTEWRLYAKPEQSLPANSELRKLLQMPVGRLTCDEAFLKGKWEFALPHTSVVPVTIKGVGELVDSWEARLGLLGDFKDKKVYSQVEITAPSEEVSKFDRDISGIFTLLDKCGTANGALHKKAVVPKDGNLPPLFMLLDPTRTGNADGDSFVFSISTRRYEYGEYRPVIAKLDPSWRQSDTEETQAVDCHIPILWTISENILLKPSSPPEATFSVPRDTLDVNASTEACESAHALLSCRLPFQSPPGEEWPRGEWREVDKVHERGTFKALAWLLERTRDVQDQFTDWQHAEVPHDLENCPRCAPQSPTVKWKIKGKKVSAIEDSREAGRYERDLKRRPSPFVTRLKFENDIGTVQVGLNIPSLLHRALSRLPQENRTEKPLLTWRLDTDFAPAVKISLPVFNLLSNKKDTEHKQPPNFKTPLRPEQLRSLEWMLRQEAADVEPFIEEEISEAILEPLGWRAEGRAQRPVRIRGGVLADQVGYGKTAITLGLIDCASKSVREEFEARDEMKGKVPVKATLVIVPPHLTRQWQSETQKFAPKRFRKTVVISTAAQINSMTVKEVQEADLVIVASNLFKSDVYLANLEAFAAGGSLPSQDGRYFEARLDLSLQSLKQQVDLLQDEGGAAVMKAIKEARRAEQELEAQIFLAPKRLKGKTYRDAATEAEKKNVVPKDEKKVATQKAAADTEDEDQGEQTRYPAKRTPSGMMPEVFISKRTSSSKVSSSAGAGRKNSAGGNKRARRASTKVKPIIISDDEDEAAGQSSDFEMDSEDDIKPKKGSRPSSRGKTTAPPTSESDFEVSSEEDDSDGEDDFVVSSDDGDDSSKKKLKKPAAKPQRKAPVKKGKGKVKVKASQSSDDERESSDAMDVDDGAVSSPSSSGAPSKKRKATKAKEAPAKKRKLREDTDPWHLESAAVKKDWTQTRSPPLEVFHFARVVVDEYTYLEGKVHSMATRLTADRRWVLSGTPPIHDFGSVKTIAAHLNLHLGIDDDDEGQSALIKKRKREQTDSERFHSFREVHSQEWHAHRHQLGQTFLNSFVRQNIAEIDEIPCSDEIRKVVLPAAERAIYLELEHHLRALDMTIKRGRKTESDREKRLATALGESKSAEEALLKRCSHFDLDTSDKENAMKACEVIVAERTKQMEDCKAELEKALVKAVAQEKKIGKVPDESMFQEYSRVCRVEGVGDQEAAETVKELLDEANVPVTSAPKNKKRDEIKLSEKMKEAIWEHREHTHEIRRLTKELVGRVRSLRYFTVVRDLQKQRDVPPVVDCPSCGRKELPMDEVAVLSSCGHTGCITCVRKCADMEECVYAASGICKAAARSLNIVKGDTLGVDDVERDGRGKHFGMKLEKVIQLIKHEIPSDSRVLFFVQFPDLMKKVAEALKENGVSFLEIRGSASQRSKSLEQFQNDSKERILLLTVTDESASGANLTSANHAIFLSPLLTDTQQDYDAYETQAIGRLRRYGQLKHVTIWRFFTTDTIDEEIYFQRTGEKI
ncbi:hypothetical protein CONPUDRAFT_107802 [Coniophora puteana RWD-64-598 SS2]|uniref:Helicase C-terminal domain-containing protein n=1 Tax=Coniophora puteana (strain RWD-64-598) TaxID=741705 RepID=A0A5M3MLG8_CONPW|nr:uncharacterized protein CONPUDRAFT_107802 [Coniophora puteana RWD-64-598 SS2]EIW79421.1 hypothetical protein CONPUDRAFT_107802 [Coniophora puteana RWD-64-598 SS2]